MYQGIVSGSYPVTSCVRKPGLLSFALTLPAPLREGLSLGCSVALDGVCFTVSKLDDAEVWFDAMQETLDRTTFKHCAEGTKLNVERSAKIGDEIGGHIVSGHVDGTATIVAIERAPNNVAMTFEVDPRFMRYILPKGFIALNGASLTVNAPAAEGTFTIHFIPQTLEITTFGEKQVNDEINFEIDRATQAIVDTVERYMASR